MRALNMFVWKNPSTEICRRSQLTARKDSFLLLHELQYHHCRSGDACDVVRYQSQVLFQFKCPHPI